MYLNLVELSESFGVSERIVEDWIRHEGLPHVRDRGRVLFDRARVAHWAAEHGLTAKAGFLAPENGYFTTGLELAPMLRAGGVWRDVPSTGVVGVLERVVASLTHVPQPVRDLLQQRLRSSNGVNWAPVGRSFALPHFSTRVTLGRNAGVVALLLLREAMPLAMLTEDATPITRLFFFIPPSPRAHLDTLARLSTAIAKGGLQALLSRGATDTEILDVVARADATAHTESRERD